MRANARRDRLLADVALGDPMRGGQGAQGGEDAPEMMKRLQAEVIDMKPDLVIWQVGTNDAVKGADEAAFRAMVARGIGIVRGAGIDLVIVDQHAAHERLVYERMKAESEGGAVARQALLLPEVVELDPAEGPLEGTGVEAGRGQEREDRVPADVEPGHTGGERDRDDDGCLSRVVVVDGGAHSEIQVIGP